MFATNSNVLCVIANELGVRAPLSKEEEFDNIDFKGKIITALCPLYDVKSLCVLLKYIRAFGSFCQDKSVYKFFIHSFRWKTSVLRLPPLNTLINNAFTKCTALIMVYS